MHVTLPADHLIDERKERIRFFGLAVVVGVLLLLNALGIFRTVAGVNTAIILTLIAGYRTFYNAINGLLEKRITADLAIVVAVVAALAVGEYLAAAEATFIMLIGEGLEGYAAIRTHSAIKRFVEQMPHHATAIRNGQETVVHADELQPGEQIIVKAGERIPADGVIAQGVSSIDESTITGESLPRDKQPGDEVFCGTLNGAALLRIRVTRAGHDTTLSRVIHLVEDAKKRKAPVERLADRYARYFLPALTVVAAATQYFTGDWMRTVSVLIVACPCALILATPAAMVAAIGGLARRGILVRGGAVLQQAAKVEAVYFDKTGTLTEGRFTIIRVLPLIGTDEEVLSLAAAAESGSEHTLARVIVDEVRQRHLPIADVTDARVLPGRGAEAILHGQPLRAGSARFMEEVGVAVDPLLLEEADSFGASAIFVATGTELRGMILLRDRVRAGAQEAIRDLGHLGVKRLIMITGDRRKAAEAIAREVGISKIDAELLPEQKLGKIRHMMSHNRVTAMVGDGINDAPALAAADVGIAVSGATDVSAEAADIFYLGQSLHKLPKLFEVSRRAVTIVWQNIIVFAGIVNVTAVGLAAWGELGPIGAAITHQIASLLVMLNSLRLLRIEPEKESRFQVWWRGLGVQEWVHHSRHTLSHFDPSAAFADIWRSRDLWSKPILAVILLALLLNGFYILQPHETGVVERMGKVLALEGPGPHYKLPWPIDRMTRVPTGRVQALEIGFRSGDAAEAAEPAAYEWNIQHRGGKYQRQIEEALMLTGDQNMIEVNATVHYRIAEPGKFLFNHKDAATTLRAAGEAALRHTMNSSSLDAVLTTGRREVENAARTRLTELCKGYNLGVEILAVRLLDVHPSVEVVDAFRDVAGAYEEKSRLINEAEGYRNEQVALARGNAEAAKLESAGYKVGRINRAAGEGDRFTQLEANARSGQALTESRLYLETVEQLLPGKQKMIVDSGNGRRQLYLLESNDGLTVPGLQQMMRQAPPALPANEEREQ